MYGRKHCKTGVSQVSQEFEDKSVTRKFVPLYVCDYLPVKECIESGEFEMCPPASTEITVTECLWRD